MFDIGWTEMAIVALLALVVIGPKDLPKAMQTVARWVRRARSLTREFQSGLDEMIRDADLDEAKKAIEASRNFSVEKTLSETVDPTGVMREEARALDSAARDSAKALDEAGKAGMDDGAAAAKPPSTAETTPTSETRPAASETAAPDGAKPSVSGG